MRTRAAWANRTKAIVFGLGLGLALHTCVNWWRIYADHVPECGKPNCVADFAAIYTGAELIWKNPQKLYDPVEQLARQQQIAPTERALPFVYPPITAALMSPLARLSFSAAFVVITLVNFAFILESLRLLIRHLKLSVDQTQWLVIIALCNFGVQAAVFLGQTSPFVLFLLTRHALSQKQSNGFTSGYWTGFLCIKPQFFTLPYFVLLLRRRWKQAILATFAAIVLMGGSFVWIGFDATRQYFHLLQEMTTHGDWTNPPSSMHNLRALAAVWFPTGLQSFVWLGGCVFVIASVIVCNLRTDSFATIWGINTLALLLISPHLFTHDLTLLVLPCALFLSLFKDAVPIYVGLSLVLLSALPIVNYILPTIMATALLILYALGLMLGLRRSLPPNSSLRNPGSDPSASPSDTAL